MVTDIVVTTCDRLETLQKTIRYILKRTTPDTYRITVVDDLSQDKTWRYLTKLEKAGIIYRAILRPERLGCTRYFDGMFECTESDPVVFTDDDILCPKLEPDWLSQGLEAMETHPGMGLIALNNPEANLGGGRALKQPGEIVTTIQAVGGTFGFIRREVLKDCGGIGIPALNLIPAQSLCYRIWMHPKHWKIGYLTYVYCYHNQNWSVRARRVTTNPRRYHLLNPEDENTLEPRETLRG